jgi:predicted transposase YbfD/YdcC
MDAQVTGEILRVLGKMPEPRRHNTRHKLIDILTIGLLAVICGAEGWVSVVLYAQRKADWLKSFLELPGGIPSHDTFGRVFARLDPEAFERCFREWISAVVELSGGQLVAIDGKSLRRSFEHGWDKIGMTHLVSAFVQANSLVLAQVQTDGKGRELEGIEKLLKLLALQGAVVTIDALGCQKHIAGLIVEAKADYLLQVKENQPTLHAKLQRLLAEAVLEKLVGWRGEACQSIDGDHGRVETRTMTVLWDVQDLGAIAREWPGLKSVARLEATRELNGQKSTEFHYYISTLDRRRTARQFLDYARGHWSVENNCHWQLDVSFNEDQRRIRKGHGAENFSRLCRIALNLLQREKTQKVGIANKRLACGWDNQYLLKVVAG